MSERERLARLAEALESLEKWHTCCDYCGKQVWLYGQRREHKASCPFGAVMELAR